MNYSVYRKTDGLVVSVSDQLPSINDANFDFVVGAGAPGGSYVKGGVLKTHPQKPVGVYSFDLDSESWIDDRSLDDVKQEKWSQIKRERELAEFGGFALNGKTFDSDSYSQSKIQGAVQLALLADDNFNIEWTLADDSIITISKPTLLAIGIALGQHVSRVHQRAREVRAQIEASTSIAEVEAIEWGVT